MSGAERRWAWLVALLLSVALSLPYLLAWAQTPRDAAFMGSVWNPDDPCVYLSWMRQAADGRFLFAALFTTEPGADSTLYTNPLFLALGGMARLTGLSLPVAYALARFVFGAWLLYLVYATTALFTPRQAVRRGALWLAGTSSGLGWLYRALDLAGGAGLPKLQCVDIAYVGGSRDAIGLAMPELNTALSVMLLPLFSASMCLMLVALGQAWRAVLGGSTPRAVWAGVALLLLGSIHTYDVIPVALTLVAFGVLAVRADLARARAVARVLLTIALLGAPAVVYVAALLKADPIFRSRSPAMASPSALSYAVSLGIPLLLAMVGAVHVVRRRRRELYPLLAWAAFSCGVAFLPGVTFQRKLIEGAHIPVCILSAVAVTHAIAPWFARRRRLRPSSLRQSVRTVSLLAIAVCLPSTLVFVQRAQLTWGDNNLSRGLPPYYMPLDDLRAMDWLRDHTARGSVVLASPLSGAYIPGISGNRVVAGHFADTLSYGDKLGEMAGFYRARDVAARAGFLRRYRVRYLLYGTMEHGLPGSPDVWLSGIPSAVVFRQGGAAVYEIGL